MIEIPKYYNPESCGSTFMKDMELIEQDIIQAVLLNDTNLLNNLKYRKGKKCRRYYYRLYEQLGTQVPEEIQNEIDKLIAHHELIPSNQWVRTVFGE